MIPISIQDWNTWTHFNKYCNFSLQYITTTIYCVLHLVSTKGLNNTVDKYCNICISTNTHYNNCISTNNYCNTCSSNKTYFNTWTNCNTYFNIWNCCNTYFNTLTHCNKYCNFHCNLLQLKYMSSYLWYTDWCWFHSMNV